MKIYLLIFLFLITISLNANLLIVNPENQTCYQTIMSAVEASVHQDTILVYPGTYQENVNYIGKHITINSLYAIDPDTSYINNTIIDGRHLDHTVKAWMTEIATLNGFTIINGKNIYGYRGGGVSLRNVLSFTLSNCKIHNNYCHSGGGIGAANSTLYLNNCEIYENQAISGGGVYFLSSQVVMSETQKNSIYRNHASKYADIFIYDPFGFNYVLNLKIFTMENPDQYFIYPVDTLQVNAEIYTDLPIYADLYVSAEGDDSHDGLTPDAPLKSLHIAMRRIKSDGQVYTLHIKNGLYSTQDQLFPLQVKHNIHLQGESRDSTIFDGINKRPFFDCSRQTELAFKLSNLWFKRGYDEDYNRALYFIDMEGVFENIRVSDCVQELMMPIQLFLGKYYLNRVIIDNNKGSEGIRCSQVDSLTITNSIFRNNRNFNGDPWDGAGGGIVIIGYINSDNKRCHLKIENVLFENNKNNDSGTNGGTSALVLTDCIKGVVNNCTFTGNISNNGYSIMVYSQLGNSDLSFTNCIFYNNIPNNQNIKVFTDTIFVSHTLLQGGESCITCIQGGQYVLGEGIIDTNPVFMNTGTYPFRLSQNSPCIDAGTLSIPGYEFPNTDLSGQPRLYGESVDLGAYEWNPSLVNTDHTEIIIPELICYPNPFNPTTTISWSMPDKGIAEISVYNIKGQKVKTLTNQAYAKGKHQLIWNGKNEYQQSVSSGIYFIRLEHNGKNQTKKVILMK